MYINGYVQDNMKMYLTSSVNAGDIDANLNIYTEIDNTEKESPSVTVVVGTATEDFPESRIWHVPVEVRVSYIAYDNGNLAYFKDIVADVVDVVTSTDLVTGMEKSGQLEIFDYIVQSVEDGEEDDSWVATITLELICQLKI